MARRTDITAWLDELLDAPSFKDYCPNGLQVEGAAEVTRVTTGVSASLALFEAAAANSAQMVLVHHGLFWKSDWPLRVQGAMRRRLTVLLENDLSLLGYHLPLDAHPEVGNNAVAARELSLGDVRPFGDYNGKAIGFSGRLPQPQSVEVFAETIRALYGQDPLVLPGTKPAIETVGIISGGAGYNYTQAVAAGLDAYVTGEPTEPAMHLAREEGVHFLAAGHYATERLGIRALGEKLAAHFDLEVELVDLPNPV